MLSLHRKLKINSIMDIKEVFSYEPKPITCRYSNDELEDMMRSHYRDYKTFALHLI